MTDRSNVVTLDQTAWAVACDIADQLEHSWNSADAAGYVEPFADDVDYITIRGRHLTGRAAIRAETAATLAALGRPSSIGLRVTTVRCLAPSVITAQIESVLDATSGAGAGDGPTVATLVVVDTTAGWVVVTVHTTTLARSEPVG